MAQHSGKVASFNSAKGVGFLRGSEGEEVFVHYTSVQNGGYKSLKEGDEVEFEIVQGVRGPQASWVTVLKQCSV